MENKASSEAIYILFIDRAINDYQHLLSGIKSDVAVHLLSPEANGVDQITRILQTEYAEAGIQEIHIVSHGSPGSLTIGSAQLNLDNFESYAWDLKAWFPPLSIYPPVHLPLTSTGAATKPQDVPSYPPSLVLYGCNVAAGDAGEAFIRKLECFTGANVAASKTVTGNVALGGNWLLEVKTQEFEVSCPFEAEVLTTYQSTL